MSPSLKPLYKINPTVEGLQNSTMEHSHTLPTTHSGSRVSVTIQDSRYADTITIHVRVARPGNRKTLCGELVLGSGPVPLAPKKEGETGEEKRDKGTTLFLREPILRKPTT